MAACGLGACAGKEPLPAFDLPTPVHRTHCSSATLAALELYTHPLIVNSSNIKRWRSLAPSTSSKQLLVSSTSGTRHYAPSNFSSTLGSTSAHLARKTAAISTPGFAADEPLASALSGGAIPDSLSNVASLRLCGTTSNETMLQSGLDSRATGDQGCRGGATQHGGVPRRGCAGTEPREEVRPAAEWRGQWVEGEEALAMDGCAEGATSHMGKATRVAMESKRSTRAIACSTWTARHLEPCCERSSGEYSATLLDLSRVDGRSASSDWPLA